MIINKEVFERFCTGGGGLYSKQIKLLRTNQKSGWKKRLFGTEITEETLNQLIAIKTEYKLTPHIPFIRLSKAERKRRKKERKAIKRAQKRIGKDYKFKIPEIKTIELKPYTHPLLGKKEYNDFFQTTAWKQLRYLALKNAHGACQCCGARAIDGAQLQVDHIKPRSRYPEFELTLENLQVLCKVCNQGKGDWDETEWNCKTDLVIDLEKRSN